MQKKQTSLSEDVKPKKGKGETISELAHRHLRDEHHTTTDEELRNAMVELGDPAEARDISLFDVDNTTIVPSAPDDLNTEDVKSEDGDDNVPNPYSVLSK